MVQKCVLCKRQDPTVTLHVFPADTAMRSVWLEALSLEEDEIFKFTKICSRHFARECFKKHLGRRKVTLTRNSVPTLHLKKRRKILTDCGEPQPCFIDLGSLAEREDQTLQPSETMTAGLDPLALEPELILNRLSTLFACSKNAKNHYQNLIEKFNALKEKIRDRDKILDMAKEEIAALKDTIEDLKRRNMITDEAEAVLLKCCNGFCVI